MTSYEFTPKICIIKILYFFNFVEKNHNVLSKFITLLLAIFITILGSLQWISYSQDTPSQAVWISKTMNEHILLNYVRSLSSLRHSSLCFLTLSLHSVLDTSVSSSHLCIKFLYRTFLSQNFALIICQFKQFLLIFKMCLLVCAQVMVHLWKSEGDLWESLVSSHHVGPWDLSDYKAWEQIFFNTEPPHCP